MGKKNPTIPRSKHAVVQERYHRKKMETHRKMQFWIPKEYVAAFLKSFERMTKKWERGHS
jgi:hypothetical protein